MTGQGPEFGTRLGFLGRQHEKKSEEGLGVIMALLEKTLLDDSKFLVFYVSILSTALCRVSAC